MCLFIISRRVIIKITCRVLALLFLRIPCNFWLQRLLTWFIQLKLTVFFDNDSSMKEAPVHEIMMTLWLASLIVIFDSGL